jgi:hypothetical protein
MLVFKLATAKVLDAQSLLLNRKTIEANMSELGALRLDRMLENHAKSEEEHLLCPV